MAEGRGLSSLTVSGLRPRDARLIFLARDLVVGQKLFLCRVGRVAIPRPVKVDPPFPHAGPARLAVKSNRSPSEVPLKLNPQAERGVWCFGGGFLVVVWLRSGCTAK